jgi:hypothetical protein
MPITDLPQTIKDHILNKVNCYNTPYQHMPNGYTITELLYCIRKSYCIRTNLTKKSLNIESAYNIYRGNVFDDLWSPLFKRNQIRCTHRIKGFPICISGKFDWLDGDTVTDLKTAKTLYFINEPSEEYKKQVRFYAYCNAFEKAQIVYVDFGDCKVFPVEVGDCSQLIAEIEAKAIQLWTALNQKKAPEKNPLTPQYQCDYCEFKKDCESGNV